jgi:hypothetical protein
MAWITKVFNFWSTWLMRGGVLYKLCGCTWQKWKWAYTFFIYLGMLYKISLETSLILQFSAMSVHIYVFHFTDMRLSLNSFKEYWARIYLTALKSTGRGSISFYKILIKTSNKFLLVSFLNLDSFSWNWRTYNFNVNRFQLFENCSKYHLVK